MRASNSLLDKAFNLFSSQEIRHRYFIVPSLIVVEWLLTLDSRSVEPKIDNGPAECETPPGPTCARVREGDRITGNGPPQDDAERVSASWPVADVLRMGSGKPAEIPTNGKEVLARFVEVTRPLQVQLDSPQKRLLRTVYESLPATTSTCNAQRL
jgi:hypothetical protein